MDAGWTCCRQMAGKTIYGPCRLVSRRLLREAVSQVTGVSASAFVGVLLTTLLTQVGQVLAPVMPDPDDAVVP
jgi:hypothetical protein